LDFFGLFLDINAEILQENYEKELILFSHGYPWVPADLSDVLGRVIWTLDRLVAQKPVTRESKTRGFSHESTCVYP